MTATDTELAEGRVYLMKLREDLSYTQAEMARGLGMSLRSYSDLETGVSRCRKIHLYAAERLTLREAAKRENPWIAAVGIRQDAERCADLTLATASRPQSVASTDKRHIDSQFSVEGSRN